jgi:hypothetical protein
VGAAKRRLFGQCVNLRTAGFIGADFEPMGAYKSIFGFILPKNGTMSLAMKFYQKYQAVFDN